MRSFSEMMYSLYAASRKAFIPFEELRLLLNLHPSLRVRLDEPPLTIAVGNVASWQDWQDWQITPSSSISSRRNLTTHLPNLEGFIICDAVQDWECDIQDIAGLSCSKSDLTALTSLDELARPQLPALAAYWTEEKLRQNLAHKEIRILHSPGSDYFIRYLWDGRFFLMNTGGSHHFAAARLLAAHLKHKVSLRGELITYSINPKVVAGWQQHFDLFALASTGSGFMHFQTIMDTHKAAYLCKLLPRPYQYAYAVFLPKDNAQSVKAAAVLRAAGLLDFGEYLASLVRRQNTVQPPIIS